MEPLRLMELDQPNRDYPERISEILRPSDERSPLVLDLFAGCGGLALGFEAQGFETIGFEMDESACATYSRNLGGDCVQMFLEVGSELPPASVIIGGPPCQPFSVGGRQLGLADARDGFPTFISAVERIRPHLWLFENVRGMFYKSRPYLTEVLDALADLGYQIDFKLLNAKYYEVPQNRERLIVVGHDGSFEWPEPGAGSLVTAGEALGDLADQVPEGSKFLTPSMDAYVGRYEKASKCIRPRDLHLDRPARTITCRNLAGATGDMQRIRLADGRRRRLTVREGARLQSFPDWFDFEGGETAQFNQIGNAVAPMFAHHLARSVRRYLDQASTSSAEAPQLTAA
jgi:DNA (cytosine-5)-methyltransferase 1